VFRYRLQTPAGEDLGDHVTTTASWNVGDIIIRGPDERGTTQPRGTRRGWIRHPRSVAPGPRRPLAV
jgi:hypothetical protein